MPLRFVALHTKAVRVVRTLTCVHAIRALIATITLAVALVAKMLGVNFLFLFALKTAEDLFRLLWLFRMALVLKKPGIAFLLFNYTR